MPSRYCLQCGQSFGDGKGKARYCSARCRKAAFVARHASDGGPVKAAPKVVVAAPIVPDAPYANLGDLEAAVMAEIGATAARTVVGMNALLVARQLDAGEERGTAMAALSRQLQTLVMEAKRGPGAAPDIVDDLSARRQARQGA